MKLRLLLPLLACTTAAFAENEVGFLERFALAADREKALAELLPGTPDYYYYTALQLQNTRQAAKLTTLLAEWKKRYPANTPQRETIENREALLAYDADPKRTLEFLRRKLGLQFNHTQERPDRKPDFPTRLDPALVALDAFRRNVLNDDNLSGLDAPAAERLVIDKVPLRPVQRRSLLLKLQQPNLPGLVEIIAADLSDPGAPPFGSYPIHGQLLPAQLDQLVKLRPELGVQSQFVYLRLRQLGPGPEEDIDYDPAAREAWLDRAWAYAGKLPAAFNSLKAIVLYRRLEHDRAKGVYDEARLIEYLKLPNRSAYLPKARLERLQNADTVWVNQGAGFPGAGKGLTAIGDDEPLVRDYFLHLFPAKPTAGWERFAEWVSDQWLKPVYAEALLVRGLGNAAQLSALLPASDFQRLNDRVDLDFPLTNRQFSAPGEEVSIDVEVKNAPKLIVKLYELNALNYFLANQRQLNTDLPLDGLVANTETTHSFDEAPIRRVKRTFTFPELKGRRGAWVVEFIGGGRSSRALIRKGQWQLIQRTGPAGDLLTVLDEAYRPVPNAAVWLDGRKFTPDPKTAEISIPFTQQAGPRPVVVADETGSFATLTEFEQHSELPFLKAQFYLDQEQLLAGREATLGIRPSLQLNDAKMPLSLLSEATLSLTTRTREGIATTREIKDLKFDSTQLYQHRFIVPERLASVEARLSGQVAIVSGGGEKAYLEINSSWQTHQIDSTAATFDSFLGRFAEGYVFDVIGKNGEPVADQQVAFQFKHQNFEREISAVLRSDTKGRIVLGALPGISRVRSMITGLPNHEWGLTDATHLGSDYHHFPAGAPFEIPLISASPRATLIEQRDGTSVADLSNTLVHSAQGGIPYLAHPGLPAGDYTLFVPETGSQLTIKVSAGTVGRGWSLNPARRLELTEAKPLRVAKIETGEKELVVTLANSNPFTRVDVAATRFFSPESSLVQLLDGILPFGGREEIPARMPNLFAAGRDIGDEYRYILERRYAAKFPGNLLARPGLLLNPWEKRSTDQIALAQRRGERAGATAGGRAQEKLAAENMPATPPGALGAPHQGENTANLDFLDATNPILLDLVPDKDGIVRIDRKQLGDRALVQILASGPRDRDWRLVPLPEVATKQRDLRLTQALDPAKPFTEKKRFSTLNAGETLTLPDRASSELETYDTLGSVFALYQALGSGNETLAKFAWVLTWPKLSDEEKRAKYSEFACHELSFFLSRKDPAFFEAVIRPYLQNKKEKTFLDEYQLGSDLKRYLEPWRFGQLNAAERALLANRLPGEAASIARHLRERWELIPPNPDEQNRLFEVALRGRMLEDGYLGKNGRGDFANKEADDRRIASGDEFQFKGKARAESRSIAAQKPMPQAAMIAGLAEADAPPPPPAAPAPVVAGSLADGLAKLEEPAAYSEFSGKDAAEAREEAAKRAYYRRVGATKEWAENNYYRLPIQNQGPELIMPNAFWRDFAAWIAAGPKTPFLSANFAEAHRNFSEMMLALAVLDLPFEAPKHETKTEGPAFTLTAGGPVIVVHQEILPAALSEGQAELLVSQNFYRFGQRYRQEGNERFDRYVTDEFLAGAVYVANVVVTNPTSSPQKIELLLQIPRGALPVLGARATDSRRVRLEPFTTQSFEYAFYFPAPGEGGQKFAHYPVQVARDEKVVGSAKPFAFPVVARLTQVDKASWEYVSQNGSEADVFAYLEQNNLERLDLAKVAWRCRESADFYRRLVALLGARHRFDPVIYSYAIVHRDTPNLREWLRQRDDLAGLCGPWLESSLVRFDPVERRSFEQLDYSPLVNPRVHRLGADHRIANSVVLQQYRTLLTQIAYQPAVSAENALSIVGFLFLQDRVEEALARFSAIKAEALPTRLQYDYFRCYAALYQADLAAARGVANQYTNHPVERWRTLFREVLGQLDEIEGKTDGVKRDDTQPNRDRDTATLANTQPSFEFKVENRAIALTWQNLTEVTVNYYLIDPEFSFSSNPFVGADAGRSSIIKPTQSTRVPLAAGASAQQIPLPAEFARANVLVEIVGAGQRQTQTYHANTFTLTVAEQYGRLDLRDQAAGKPLAKAYVKVYARLNNGTVRFFKDGYTDLRGKFDYASLNTGAAGGPIRPMPVDAEAPGGTGGGTLDSQMLKPGEYNQIARLSVLVLSEANGAIVREVGVPRE